MYFSLLEDWNGLLSYSLLTRRLQGSFYLMEPGRLAILVVPLKVAFSSVPYGVLTKTLNLLFAFLSPVGFNICPW
jgi:hypothetical protein